MKYSTKIRQIKTIQTLVENCKEYCRARAVRFSNLTASGSQTRALMGLRTPKYASFEKLTSHPHFASMRLTDSVKQFFYQHNASLRLILLPLILLFSLKSNAQFPTTEPVNPNLVSIIKADSLVGINQGIFQQRKLIGNVVLRQATTLVYCNLAILNETTNILEAYGKVKIIQADTVTITGDTAYYFGNERKAKINGRVKLDDKTVVITTNKMDYDLNSSVAYYNTGGKVVDKKSTLTSKEAYYNTDRKSVV